MSKRTGRLGDFYGCSKYPKCKRTVDARDASRVAAAQQAAAPAASQQQVKREFTPSPYQLAVFSFVTNGKGNAFVNARAGSGKTTTIVKALELTPKVSKVLFCAFNTHIKEELARRAPSHVKVQTMHSLGFAALRNGLPVKPEVDENKLLGIVKEFLPDYETDGALRGPLMQLVSLAKNTLTDPEDRSALDDMAYRYGVDLNGDTDRIMNLVAPVMAVCASRTSVIDYDDMVWLPIRLRMHFETYDWVFVDEAQDLNAAQIEILMRTIRPKVGRVVAVGDPQQSIYGFRGADINAIPKLIETLQAITLPLSISYRCPVSHIELAKEIVQDIEAAPGAKAGSVVHTTWMRAFTTIQDGDLVLCRCNAPLVSAVYAFIKSGRKAVIRGRDIGKNLLSFIDKMKPTSIVDLVTKVQEYKFREVERLTAAGKEGQVQSLQDKCECIEALCDGVRDLSELRLRIQTIFDDDTKTGIVLSSVHRAKGDEADRVWILKPELLPLPMGQEWEQEQEMNIKYVALTRSKSELVFVEGAK